ncbi:peptidylprolyl isomerase [Massilia yuzhufengensis]|uniref:Peptidyl-prolyl cis-trans isomerase n=1 Tax=Massilia yuzhufengensis TaxID=1164594 RepID=A0A1I1EAR1_9BURK|nr:peptidylprolyl isomerase [Massilia yuzhufengensis]SFB83816.1 peptidyl-prolyl cis-trans isomerase A (cyclophilin A)/peptidyl-prolyl cis-trans isomerase B (cyclophilin B) [Massilia yuzhufengensis]
MTTQIPFRRPALQRLALGAAALFFSGLALASPQTETPAAAVPDAAPVAPVVKGPQVSVKTTMGEIVLQLDEDKAPKTVANFMQYVKQDFYKGTIFHRVIEGFMIQAGGMNEKFEGRKTNKPVKNESNNGLSNQPYTVSMAREEHPDSATSQFFINVADNSGIDHPFYKGSGYTVFGKVVKGQDVVDKIKGVMVDDVRGMQNVPVKPIFIKSVTVLKGDKLVK